MSDELQRLRRFAELIVGRPEWGPVSPIWPADMTDDQIWQAAIDCGVLVEEPHRQPCRIDGCPCDGADTLALLAWEVDRD